MIRFGPAGAADSFAAMGYKKTAQMPEYLEKMGLTAFEYQCGRGVRITDEAARALGEGFRQRDIAVSLHAPYYISMSSLDEEKRLGSLRYILESARAVTAMGGRRIVIHAGSTAKMPRADALELALDTFRRAIAALDEAGYSQVIPCPEVMGKLGQLGDLSEVLAMCGVDERMLPCIDFGHLNARAASARSEPRRIMPQCWTPLKMPSVWTGPDRSTAISPRSSTPKMAGKNGTSPLRIRSMARSSSRWQRSSIAGDTVLW